MRSPQALLRSLFILTPAALVVFVALAANGGGDDAATPQQPANERAGKEQTELYEARTHQSKVVEGGSLPYRLITPLGYDPAAPEKKNKKYPLVLLLHGAGERGDDNARQLTWGGQLLGVDIQPKFPCFVVAPQCPEGQQWVNTPWGEGSYSTQKVEVSDPMKMAIEIVEAVRDEFDPNVDPDRIYVTGLSMGGYGTWDAAVRRPDLFAAAVPICGAGDPSAAQKLKNTAVWAFHGSDDGVVPPAGSREMIDALKALGAEPKYTEYPGVGHDSWVKAWAEPDLFPWLFDQKLAPKEGRP